MCLVSKRSCGPDLDKGSGGSVMTCESALSLTRDPGLTLCLSPMGCSGDKPHAESKLLWLSLV